MWLSQKGTWKNYCNKHNYRNAHLAKIKSLVIVLAAWREYIKVNFCDASELMLHFAVTFFNTSTYFKPIMKQIVVIKFMKFFA